MATNGTFAHQEQYKGSADTYTANPASIDPANAAGASNDLSKDEVGWYFVEQYYTTLSKFPEKLHVSSLYGRKTVGLWLMLHSSSTASGPSSLAVSRPRLPTSPSDARYVGLVAS